MTAMRRRFYTRPPAAPYVDALVCPSCRRNTVEGRRTFWGVAVLECAPCGLRMSPCEYEARLDIATSGVLPGGAA